VTAGLPRFGLVLAAVAGVTWGCATQHGTVSKIVGGRVIITRSVDPNAYEHVARALLFEEEERYQEAITELERALNFDRDAPEIHARIAEVNLKLDRVDEAARAVKASLALGETVDGLVADAHVRARRGDHLAAVASLRKAVGLTRLPGGGPDSGEIALTTAVDAHLELADAQLESLDVDGARVTLRALADGLPGGAVARIRLAAVAWALGAPTEAETRLREALAVEPNHVEALLMLAWLYTAEGRTDEAGARFSEALERSEGALDVAAAYARFLMATGRQQKAIELADDLATGGGADDDSLLGRIEVERAAHRPERALALARTRRAADQASDDIKARMDIVVADIQAEKDPAGAVTTLLRVPRNAAAYPEARLRAAELKREEGKLADAERLLADAARTSPGEPLSDELAIAEAQLAEQKGALAPALARLDQAIADRPRSRRLRMARAMMLERAGRWREALDVAQALIDEDPANHEALNFWGFVAADHGHQLGKAKQRIRAALAFDPGSGAILDSLGWAHLQAGEVQLATSFLEQAGRLEPEDPEILGHQAALLARKGQRERALERLRKALQAKPDPPLRRQLEDQLRRLEAGAAGPAS
jgi:tetratricopeptide (TPR) repeat protein